MNRDTEDVVARAIQRLTDRAAMYAATVPGQTDLKTLLADRQSLSDRIDVLEDLLAEYGDRVRMARAEPSAKQWAIDEAIGNATSRAALHQEGIATVSDVAASDKRGGPAMMRPNTTAIATAVIQP